MRQPEDDIKHEEKLKKVLHGEYTAPNPQPANWLETAEKNGMIGRHNLKDGTYYYGRCRNAKVAKWDAAKAKFTYMREKFGHTYHEDINHIADDNGFDCFIPVAIVEPNEEETV